MPHGPRIAHVGVAVASIADALVFYRDVLGLVPHPPEEADGATIVSLDFGGTEVELLEPQSPESPVARDSPPSRRHAAPTVCAASVPARVTRGWN